MYSVVSDYEIISDLIELSRNATEVQHEATRCVYYWTDTDVGKAWVGQMIIPQLVRTGINIVPRKPVESGWQTDNEKTDAWLLAHAAGKTEELELICPNLVAEDKLGCINHILLSLAARSRV